MGHQWRRRDPSGKFDKNLSDPVQRFWSYVNKTRSCWLWTGALTKHGKYGRFFASPNRRAVRAHRFSWELSRGAIAPGLGVLHRCDTPACVRPAHLFLGNQATNLADCAAKGRTTRGERNPCAILTDRIARRILALAPRGRETRRVAERLGVSYSAVRDVVSRRRWRHL